jgi:hypothetical protein
MILVGTNHPYSRVRRHIVLHCNYTQAAWNLTVDNFNLPLYGEMAAAEKRLIGSNTLNQGKKEKKRKLGILFTFWWMIWKERNRRIFEDSHLSAQQLARMARDEIQLHLTSFFAC